MEMRLIVQTVLQKNEDWRAEVLQDQNIEMPHPPPSQEDIAVEDEDEQEGEKEENAGTVFIRSRQYQDGKKQRARVWDLGPMRKNPKISRIPKLWNLRPCSIHWRHHCLQFSPAAESEAKEAKAPVEEAAEPKPVALLQTPTRKRSTVSANTTTPPTSPSLAPITAVTVPAKSPSPTSRGPTTSPRDSSLGRSTCSPTRKNASPDNNSDLFHCRR
ncbi:hypothetical protein M378DRAFT_16012 [Amanita muscaria Koide BX008]|uniref:Uncharacterized protein n=1 Tax=Amanita muscaria (strain Koide BX008) TaxID=946122 RepID=A0A0C2WM10_AMAMK|nr:hypothetical protein M378DRAFT_16012 [Amanita muscaria Koide BX008]